MVLLVGKPADEIANMNDEWFAKSLDDLIPQVARATKVFGGQTDAWSWGFYLYHTVKADTIAFYHGFKSEMAHGRTKTAAVLARSIYEAYTRLHEINDPLDVDNEGRRAVAKNGRPQTVDQDDFMRSWLAFNHQEYIRFLDQLLEYDRHMMRDTFAKSVSNERDMIRTDLDKAPSTVQRNWKQPSHKAGRHIREHLWRDIAERHPGMQERVHRIMQTWASSYVHMNITHDFWAGLVNSVVPITVGDFMQIAMGLCYRKQVLGIRALKLSKQFDDLLRAHAVHMDGRTE